MDAEGLPGLVEQPEQPVEDTPRDALEGNPGDGLSLPRSLAEEEDLGGGRAGRGDEAATSGVEVAALAGDGLGVQGATPRS